MNRTDVLVTSCLHASVAAVVGQTLDNLIKPAEVSADGAYLDKSALRETAEVLGQFVLSVWGLNEALDLLLPDYSDSGSPITDSLAYVILFQFQPKLRFKAMRLVGSALSAALGPNFARAPETKSQ